MGWDGLARFLVSFLFTIWSTLGCVRHWLGQRALSPTVLNRLMLNRMISKRLGWIGAGLLVTGMVVGVRATGLLTGLELAAFDLLLQLRPL